MHQILEQPTAGELLDRINEAEADGWQVLGGLTSYYGIDGPSYAVLMAKGEKVERASPQSHSKRFMDFWSAYPKKAGKDPCIKVWKRLRLDSKADLLIADVQERLSTDAKWKEGYIPNALTYINQKRWDDPIEVVDKSGKAANNWWDTGPGIEKKGNDNGMPQREGEHVANWYARVKAAFSDEIGG